MIVGENTAVSWLDIIVAGILLFSVLAGLWQGLLRTVYHMVKVILAIIFSSLLTPFVAVCISETVVMRGAIAYIISFVLVSIALGIVAHILGIVDHIPVLKQINKGLGAVAGLVRGLLLVWILLFVIVLLKDNPSFSEAAKMISTSPFLSELYKYNPIPVLIQQFVKTLPGF